MRKLKVEKYEDIKKLVSYLNFCHDGILKKVGFFKKRELDEEDGALIYSFNDKEDFITCDIEIEMLLNSYENAKKDQVVLLQFKGVDNFSFSQNKDFDYSNIYELQVQKNKNSRPQFVFYSTQNKIESLKIECEQLICIER